MKYIEVQFLRNVPAYKPKSWTLPSLSFDHFFRREWPWFAIIVTVGRSSIGIRFYMKFLGAFE